MRAKRMSKRQLKKMIREEKALMEGDLLEEGIITGTIAGSLIGMFRKIPVIGDMLADAIRGGALGAVDNRLDDMEARIERLESGGL